MEIGTETEIDSGDAWVLIFMKFVTMLVKFLQIIINYYQRNNT